MQKIQILLLPFLKSTIQDNTFIFGFIGFVAFQLACEICICTYLYVYVHNVLPEKNGEYVHFFLHTILSLKIHEIYFKS